jgi:GEVED domain/HYR domain
VDWTPPTITDNCSIKPTLSSNYAPNSSFPRGVTTVIYTARDDGNRASTCSFTVTVVEPDTNYCSSKAFFPYQDWVAGVQFGAINNSVQANEGKSINWSVLGYSNFTSLFTNVTRGQSYPLSVMPGFSWYGRLPLMFCSVWIDFNKNNVFEANEEVMHQLPVPSNVNPSGTPYVPYTSNVLIPPTAILGITRMRVSIKSGGFPTACEAGATYELGEVEDYTISIK